jgi:hypothetical protein
MGDMRALWQTQPAEPLTRPVNEIRERAAKFEKTIKRRDLKEYLAAAFVVAAFSLCMVIIPNTIVKIGCGLIIAGHLYVSWHLYREGSASTLPFDAVFGTCLSYHRSELMRQRDLLRGVLFWYIGPLIPGYAVFIWGIADMLAGRLQAVIQAAILMVVVALAVLGLNWWGARKLQRQIDELDDLGKQDLKEENRDAT